jgi:glycosyltransferase involved in cell wall biosynthesis
MATYYLSHMIQHAQEIRRIIRQESIDLVVLSNIAAPLAYSLMDELSSMHIPIIFDLPDYYPTSAAGYIFDLKSTKGKLLTGTFDCMLRYLIKRATAVTVASKPLLEYAKKAGARNALHISNGISESFLNLHCGQALRDRLAIDDKEIVVGYLGSLEFWLDMKNLIEGLSLARRKGLPLKLLIIGKSLHTDYPKKVMGWLKNRGLEDLTIWHDFVPYEEAASYISSFNVGTIPFNANDPTAYYAAPNKMWEYFSQMKPVISAPIPEALNNDDCVLTASTPEEYCKQLIFATDSSEEIAFKVRNGYCKALTKTWDKSAREFESLICHLTNRQTAGPMLQPAECLSQAQWLTT